jgi:hypothetical protein
VFVTHCSFVSFVSGHLAHLAKNGQCILPGKWLNGLKEEESKHNTAAALREGQSRRPIGPAAKRKTPKNLTDKTDRTSEDDQLGLIATWSVEFGYVSLHDPTTGEWWDLRTTDAPGWAMGEARRRKELYKSGNQRAYRLTAREAPSPCHQKDAP